MGARGPVPKRDAERVRRNKTGEDGVVTETIHMSGEVSVPTAHFEVKMVQDLWDSLVDSGQSKYYEPSDWQYARIALEMLDRHMVEGKTPGAMMLTAIDGMLKGLLLTEGERRRVKLEVQRTEAEGVLVNASEHFRRRFEAQRHAVND